MGGSVFGRLSRLFREEKQFALVKCTSHFSERNAIAEIHVCSENPRMKILFTTITWQERYPIVVEEDREQAIFRDGNIGNGFP